MDADTPASGGAEGSAETQSATITPASEAIVPLSYDEYMAQLINMDETLRDVQRSIEERSESLSPAQLERERQSLYALNAHTNTLNHSWVSTVQEAMLWINQTDLATDPFEGGYRTALFRHFYSFIFFGLILNDDALRATMFRNVSESFRTGFFLLEMNKLRKLFLAVNNADKDIFQRLVAHSNFSDERYNLAREYLACRGLQDTKNFLLRHSDLNPLLKSIVTLKITILEILIECHLSRTDVLASEHLSPLEKLELQIALMKNMYIDFETLRTGTKDETLGSLEAFIAEHALPSIHRYVTEAERILKAEAEKLAATGEGQSAGSQDDKK